MTRLRFETQTFRSSSLGAENPLPPLVNARELHDVDESPGVPEEILRNIGTGNIPSILPYTLQDGYDRELKPTQYDVAVLENDHLRATFLLDLGGRLWSLFDKEAGRELLYSNSCIQFANLALRNAWFAGGVEWNCGIIGHSPHTCSPMFAAEVTDPSGEPVLRLYEFERIRGVLYQLDFRLPATSKFLYVTVTIRNPHDRDVQMYWWSNIAVPQSEGTRILVPADRAFVFGYRGALSVQPVPILDGTDITYATNLGWPQDYFFDIPEDQRKWIAAVDADGYGLAQVSTQRLKGRKLFVWGTGQSGRSWQQVLSPTGGEYLEIQAGLAKTQLEYLPMPAKAWWSWTEAYGPIQADPSAVHRADWASGILHTGEALDAAVPEEQIQKVHDSATRMASLGSPTDAHHGSGWAEIENLRRIVSGEEPLPSEGLQIGNRPQRPEEAPWLRNLSDGTPPGFDPASPSFMVQEQWRELLQDAPYHLGILEWNAGNRHISERAWLASLEAGPNPWAHRNLAVLYLEAGEAVRALSHYLQAVELEPECRTLAIECATFLLETDPASVRRFAKAGPFRDDSRMRLIAAQAAMELGDIEGVRNFFVEVPVVTDLREGETAYDDLVRRYQAATGSGDGQLSFQMTPD